VIAESAAILELQDLDLALIEARSVEIQVRRRKLGLAALEVDALERLRVRLLATGERRWLVLYERARQRYGRGVAAVRERVCSGCYMSLPRTATPALGGPLGHCESCSRLLYWR
jgi:predicted  nucleic acid-binding Zn-ribbon protein